MIVIAGIEVKNANLFVHSKTSEDYKWLKDIMIKNHNKPKLSKKEFDKLPADKREFLNLRWIEIFNLAQSEWNVVRKFEENKAKVNIDCELCGRKELDLISTIENMENGNKFIVGSTCILKFDKINSNNASDYRDYKKQKRIDERKISNEEYLEHNFNGIIRKVKEFIGIRNDETLIMNNDLKTEYDRLDKLLNSDYFELLKLNRNKINLKQINYVYDSINKFLLDIQEYRDNCEKNKWGINSKIAKWCYKNGDDQLIEFLGNNGQINYYTVDQIKEPNYLKRVIYLLKPLIEKSSMRIVNKDRIGATFNISINFKENIILDVPSILFLRMKKNYLFNKPCSNIKINEILSISNINVRSIPSALNFICRDGSFFSEYNKYFDEVGINELAFLKNSEKKIYLVDYKEIVNSFKEFVYYDKLTDENISEVKKYIQKNSVTYSINEYKKHLKDIGINI